MICNFTWILMTDYQLRKKILPALLSSMVEAENFTDHPRTRVGRLSHQAGPINITLQRFMAALDSLKNCSVGRKTNGETQ